MIRFPLKAKPVKLKGVLIGSGSGPAERIKALQIFVTKLIRDERIEGREHRMEETRVYAEQLLNLAIQNGDRHKPTMEMADKWLLEKDLVHKLFKVLAPRFSNYSEAYTSIYRLPAKYPSTGRFEAVLELKGNPYPPVIPQDYNKDNFIVNVLLRAAKQRHYGTVSEELPQSLGKSETEGKPEFLGNSETVEDLEGSSVDGTHYEGKDKVEDNSQRKPDVPKGTVGTS